MFVRIKLTRTGDSTHSSNFKVMHPAVCFHDQLASGWEKKYEKSSFSGRAVALLSLLSDQSLRGQLWLDAGCGSGLLSRMLAEQGCNVVGVDGSPQMVQAATGIGRQGLCPSAGSLEFQQVETIEQLPMSVASFDGILCSSVIEYLDHPRQCLEEFHRVLRPGGLLLLSVPNRHSLMRRVQKLSLRLSKVFLKRPWPEYLLWSRNEYSLQALVAMLKLCGFELRKNRYYAPRVNRLMSRNVVVGSLIVILAEKRALRK
jgi:2-polyprenyl-3-methyl-5-hydroxy-6-metoxy-1,4-benzoquinol methylase